jgi:transposase
MGRRCIGLDVHRDFAQVAIWQDGVVWQAGQVGTTPEELRLFADSLAPGDEVALEATGNTYAIATLLTARVARVVVSNPAKTRAIAEAKVKTDKVDAAILAQLLAADFLPPVWMPDAGTRVAPAGDPSGASGAAADQVEEPGAGDPAPQPGAPLPGGGPVRAQGPGLAGRPTVAADEQAAVQALLRQLHFYAGELAEIDADLSCDFARRDLLVVSRPDLPSGVLSGG